MRRLFRSGLLLFAGVTLVAGATLAAVRAAPKASVPPEPLWRVSFAGFDALGRRQAAIGKALGNTMLPMWLATYASSRLSKAYGPMHTAEPIRWLGYRGRNKTVDVVLVYPAMHKVAKTVLNHPGAERRGRDMLFLPKGEGRPADALVVYSRDNTVCAIAPTEALARAAVGEKPLACGEDLFAIEAKGVTGSFDFEEDALVYRSRTSDASNAAQVASVPMLGALVGDGRTHKIGFDDLKRLVAALVGAEKAPHAP